MIGSNYATIVILLIKNKPTWCCTKKVSKEARANLILVKLQLIHS